MEISYPSASAVLTALLLCLIVGCAFVVHSLRGSFTVISPAALKNPPHTHFDVMSFTCLAGTACRCLNLPG